MHTENCVNSTYVVSDNFNYVNGGVTLVMSLLSIFGNITIILIITLNKKETSLTNRVVILLALTDLLRGTVVMITKTVNHLMLYEDMTGPWCTITACSSAFTFFFNPMVLAMIAVIRYFVIVPWTKRANFLTLTKVRIILLVIFLISIFFSILPYLNVGEYKYSPSHGVCFANWDHNNIAFRTIFYTFVVGIAFPVLTYCYARLFLLLKRHNEAMRNSRRQNMNIVLKNLCPDETAADVQVLKSVPDKTQRRRKEYKVTQTLQNIHAEVETNDKEIFRNGHFSLEQHCMRGKKIRRTRSLPANQYKEIIDLNTSPFMDSEETNCKGSAFKPPPVASKIRSQSVLKFDVNIKEDINSPIKHIDVTNAQSTSKNCYSIHVQTEATINVAFKNSTSASYQVARSNGSRRYSSVISKQEYQITRTMIIIFIAYIVCWFPAAIVNITALINKCTVSAGAYMIIVTLVELKSVLNPIIYGYGNSENKKILKSYINKLRRSIN